MEAKQILIPVGLIALIVILYLYLKGGDAGADTQVSYPNANAGGLPQYQSPGVAYNFQARQPAPSPNLVYGPPPPIPPTPNYQKFNYSPINLYSLTPEGAKQVAAGAMKHTDDCCCCDCGCDGNKPTYSDSNNKTGVVANKGEQAGSTPPKLAGDLQRNLATSVATDPGLAWGYITAMMYGTGGSLNDLYPTGQ